MVRLCATTAIVGDDVHGGEGKELTTDDRLKAWKYWKQALHGVSRCSNQEVWEM
jgi:hypothetical protein